MASKLTIDSLGDAVARALGQRLVALLLYGSAARGTNVRDRSDINTLLICDAADDALFDALAPVVREWTRARHPAPLILTEREWRESADAFPIEYEDMRDAHRLLAGRDPWQGISVRRDDVRRQLLHDAARCVAAGRRGRAGRPRRAGAGRGRADRVRARATGRAGRARDRRAGVEARVR